MINEVNRPYDERSFEPLAGIKTNDNGLLPLKATDLYDCGVKLVGENKADEAINYFKQCIENDESNYNAYLQLFLIYVKQDDYENAFLYFDEIFYKEVKELENDCNFYLFLLNTITDIPEEHKQYVSYLRYNDMMIKDNQPTISPRNKIRLSCSNRKFNLALKQFEEYFGSFEKLSINDEIIKVLLNKIIQKQISRDIYSLVRERKYESVVAILEKDDKESGISYTEKMILKLAKDIITVIETGKIPKKEPVEEVSLFKAIEANDYELALSLVTKVNSISLLLGDIVEEIKLISEDNEIIDAIRELSDEHGAKLSETAFELKNNLSAKQVFGCVIEFIINEDLENAFITLEEYLNSIGKIDYEFLIIDLIKLSLMEQDFGLTKPCEVMINLSDDSYQFKLSQYIRAYYEALTKEQIDIAKIYLDIISKAYMIDMKCLFTQQLEEIFIETVKRIEDRKVNKF